MSKILKRAGIPRAGLEYQDLIGIEKLLDFFRNREKYRWIELESEDGVTGYLDDVVAALSDGSFELIQVKFTADVNTYVLGWDWLLEKKGKGTSLLQKWAGTVNGFSNGPISLACLQTNRIPDAEFALSLQADGTVDFEAISNARKAEITTVLGSPFVARRFFKKFQFIHSRPMLDDLADDLRSSIVPAETDMVGWLSLLTQAKRWAMNKLQPEPDGHITHNHLTQIITKVAPRPMPQSFSVPKGYTVPREAFHSDFLKRVTAEPGITILWGTPGRGKSTYLSYLTNELRKADAPVIRHHYFLSLADTTTDRFSFPNIAQSLMDQIMVRYPDAVKGLEEEANQLPKWLAACGTYFEKMGRRFIVVIDGLDHVWRERRNLDQLDHLFDNLLPCPSNVNLVVGTQKIPDDKLPAKLIRRVTKKDWHEIPSMDEMAVHSWIKQQHSGKRLRLQRGRNDASVVHQLGAVSRAFFEISSGHPLHLIYSFEALARRGGYVDAEAVRLLPQCPDGDINAYYGMLWRKLSANSKKIVHLIAGSEFRWPLTGIVKYFGQIDEIDFLLERRRTGLIPFHGSILAFVRARTDHDSIFASLLPRVLSWLRRDAPEYTKWGWLWLMQAKGGDYRPLLRGATRDWAINSIRNGWPLDQVIEILTGAETKAFHDGDYGRAIEYRSLKTRVSNGEDYQVDDFPRIRESAILSTKNEQILDVLADGLSTLGERDILLLSRAAHVLRPGICDECMEELAYRIHLWINLRHRPTDEFVAISKYFVEGAALAPSLDTARVLKFILGFNDGSEVFWKFLKCLEVAQRVDALMLLVAELAKRKKEGWRIKALDTLIRVSAAAQVDVADAVRSQSTLPMSAFSACWCFYHRVPVSGVVDAPQRSANLTEKKPRHEQEGIAEPYLYDLFFHTLYRALKGEAFVTARKEGEFIDGAISIFETTARNIASGNSQLSFGTLYYACGALAPVSDGDYSNPSHLHYLGLTSSLRRISVDLHLIKQPTGKFAAIDDSELKIARASKHWVEELWIDLQIDDNLKLQSETAAKESLASETDYLDRHVTQFNDRAAKWAQLARFALLYGLPDADALLGRAGECIIGYGWRKDLWMNEVIDCVVQVHEHGAAQGLTMLRKLVPIVDKITEFTDGDETDYVRSELIEAVAMISPVRLPDMYEHHLANDEFRYADETLRRHLKMSDLTDAATQGVVRTFVEYKDVSALADLGTKSWGAARLLDEQVKFLGGMPPKPREYSSSSKDYGRTGTPPKVEKYGPDEFGKLIKRLSNRKLGYDHQREGQHRWLDHWDAKGKGREALKSLRKYFDEEENPYTANEILDHAFRISRKRESKKDSYYWLVKAHVHKRGWQRYYSSHGETEERLAIAAQLYKADWQKFISDSSVPEKYWHRRNYSFSIGIKYLVRFLLLVGQETLAVDFTRACIKTVMEETRDQPIPPAPWFQ